MTSLITVHSNLRGLLNNQPSLTYYLELNITVISEVTLRIVQLCAIILGVE